MLLRTIGTAVLLCFSSIYGACAKENKTILLFGDSIIAGYNLPKEDALHIKLQTALEKKGCENITVINSGISGDTTSGGRSRLPRTLKKNTPDAVFLALGGNDMLRGIPTNIIEANLDAMLSTMQEAGVPVLFSKVTAPQNMGTDYVSAIDGMFSRLSKSYNTPLYPFILEPVFGNSAYMQLDGIHPNALGVDEIAERLADAFVDNKTYADIAFICTPLI